MLQESFNNSKIYIISATHLTSKLTTKKIVPRYFFKLNNDLNISTPSFFKNRLLFNISFLIDAIRLIKKIRNECFLKKEKVLFVVNNHFYLYSLSTYLAKRRHDYMITILNEGFDVKYINNQKKPIRNTISNLIHCLIIKRNNGLITFNKKTVEKYAPNIPYISLIYTCEYSPELYNIVRTESANKTVLYAGYIDECYGIKEILEAFHLLPSNYSLILCGGGSKELIELINSECNKDKRIHFRGMIKRDEVIKLEQTVDLLLLIRTQRNPHEKYIAEYSQPSKLPEYLLSKTPILATKIDSIPLELNQFLFYCDPTPKSIAESIHNICTLKNEQKSRVIKGFEYVMKNCNYSKQKNEIICFIKGIVQ